MKWFTYQYFFGSLAVEVFVYKQYSDFEVQLVPYEPALFLPKNWELL